MNVLTYKGMYCWLRDPHTHTLACFVFLSSLTHTELSALLEEDEEGDGTTPAGSGDEAMSEGLTMELTGNTMHTPAAAGTGAHAATGGGADTTPTFTSECLSSAHNECWESSLGAHKTAASVSCVMYVQHHTCSDLIPHWLHHLLEMAFSGDILWLHHPVG